MRPKEDGILDIDEDAKPCPVCGGKPRIHVHRFTYFDVGDDGKSRKRVIRRSYYDCSMCGSRITDWCDDPWIELNMQHKYTGYGAKKAWNNHKFLDRIRVGKINEKPNEAGHRISKVKRMVAEKAPEAKCSGQEQLGGGGGTGPVPVCP